MPAFASRAVQRIPASVRLSLVVGYLRWTERRRVAAVHTVEQLPLLCLPGVFPPDSFTTRLVLRNRLKLKGKTVLDLGCGAGALSVFLATSGVDVRAADVSAEAVRNARLNLEWHGVPQVPVVESDLFSAVTGRFDTIVFNAPFFPGKARTPAEQMWLGEGGKVLERFVKEAGSRLLPGGEVWLTHSSIADEPGLHALLTAHGWSWTLIDSHDIWIETFKLYRLVPADASGARHA